MEMDGQIQDILDLISKHEEATNRQDFASVRDTLALKDERYREIEYNIPLPFDSSLTYDVIGWLEDNPGYKMRINYSDIQVFNLSETVAYAIGLNKWSNIEESGNGRVTFIMNRYPDTKWRIVHLHRSAAPTD